MRKFSSLSPLHVYAYRQLKIKMAQPKRLEQSPSSLAFSSPLKRRVMTELIAKRNIIKSKFKKTYTDRIKRERETSELLKPVTSSIAKLSSNPLTTKKIKNELDEDIKPKLERLELSPFKPARWTSSTPKTMKGILRKTPAMAMYDGDDESRPDLSTSKFFTMVDYDKGDGDDINNKLKSKKSESQQPFGISRRPRSRSKHGREGNDNADGEFDFEVTYDSQLIEDYDKPVPDNNDVLVLKTSKISGKMTPVRMKWRELPTTIQSKWMEKRKRVQDYHRSQPGGEAAGATSLQYHKTCGEKTSGKSLDFNFIPYNRNSQIIYEYFDDPNELCERLRLLVSSRSAGNTNHMQEINSIIEELRELNYIA